MELKNNDICIVLDRSINIFDINQSIKGIYDNMDEAIEQKDNLNLEHFLEVESDVDKSISKDSRYIVCSIPESINYIVSQINQN